MLRCGGVRSSGAAGQQGAGQARSEEEDNDAAGRGGSGGEGAGIGCASEDNGSEFQRRDFCSLMYKNLILFITMKQ